MEKPPEYSSGFFLFKAPAGGSKLITGHVDESVTITPIHVVEIVDAHHRRIDPFDQLL